MALDRDRGPGAVIAVLMELGLPAEIARDIVYKFGAMVHPLTTAYRTAWEPAHHRIILQELVDYMHSAVGVGHAGVLKLALESCCLCTRASRGSTPPNQSLCACGQLRFAHGGTRSARGNHFVRERPAWFLSCTCPWIWVTRRACPRTTLWMRHLDIRGSDIVPLDWSGEDDGGLEGRYLSHTPWWVWTKNPMHFNYFIHYLRGIMTEEECDEFDDELIDGPVPDPRDTIRRIMAHRS